MAIGTDRIQVTKVETTGNGGDGLDEGPFGAPQPIDPQEDVLESAGIYLQDAVDRDEQVSLFRDDGQLYLDDTLNAAISLFSLNLTTNGMVDENYDILTDEDFTAVIDEPT